MVINHHCVTVRVPSVSPNPTMTCAVCTQHAQRQDCQRWSQSPMGLPRDEWWHTGPDVLQKKNGWKHQLHWITSRWVYHKWLSVTMGYPWLPKLDVPKTRVTPSMTNCYTRWLGKAFFSVVLLLFRTPPSVPFEAMTPCNSIKNGKVYHRKNDNLGMGKMTTFGFLIVHWRTRTTHDDEAQAAAASKTWMELTCSWLKPWLVTWSNLSLQQALRGLTKGTHNHWINIFNRYAGPWNQHVHIDETL